MSTQENLLSSNPRKVRAPSGARIEVVEGLPCEAGPTAHSLAYLQTKKENGTCGEPGNSRSRPRGAQH